MDADNKGSGKTIKLHLSTIHRINALRHKGQSYDGLITELLDLHESYMRQEHMSHSSKMMRNTDVRS
jgi:hypothetical protein